MVKNSLDAFFEKQEESLEYRAELTLARLAIELSGQIRVCREKKGLSQSEMAKLLGTHQSQVSRMEDPAYAHYSMASLAKIADVLGCELEIALSVPESFMLKTEDGEIKISQGLSLGEPAIPVSNFNFPATKAA